MPKFARVICTLESDTGLPEDRCVNVFHAEGDDGQTWAEDADDLADRLASLYVGLEHYLSNTLSGNLNVRVYNMADPEPRVPVYEDDYTFAPAATSLPTECAITISMQAAPASGVNQARRRGRVFWGPLATACAELSGGRVRVPAAVAGSLAHGLANRVIGPDPGDFRLAVFSPTTLAAPGGTLAAAFSDVAEVWVDNALDTQRRRGTHATSRVIYPAGNTP